MKFSIRLLIGASLFFSITHLTLTSDAIAAFPCDLEQISAQNGGALPILYLNGERHDYLSSSLDTEIIENFGALGFLYVGMEGMMRPISGYKYLLPIEDEYLFSMSTLVTTGMSFSSLQDELGKFHQFLYELLRDLPLKNVWKGREAIAPAEGPENKKIADFIESVVSDHESGKILRRDQLLKKMTDTFQIGTQLPPGALMRYFFSYAFTFIDIFNKIYLPKIQATVNVEPVIRDEFRFRKDRGYWASMYMRYVIDYRNMAMVRKIAGHYCFAATQKKPMLVQLGQLHIAGVKKLLEELSALVPIQVRNSNAAYHKLFFARSPEEIDRALEEAYPFCPKQSAYPGWNKFLDPREHYLWNIEQEDLQSLQQPNPMVFWSLPNNTHEISH